MEPTIGRYPIEVFGTVYTDTSEEAVQIRNTQYCPYLQRECTKPRKSEPEIKVGICTVGYKGSFNDKYTPVIICPFRFLEDVVFQSIHDKFFPDWEHTKWVKEVNMGVSGNVDYVAVKTDPTGTRAEDFYCVEFQANGTTGSPYPYVKDLKEFGHYRGDYTFGLNWANEFMKTMMQQVYKKGSVIHTWGRKIVFVIQDVALMYLESAVDTSDLRQRMDDPIHFMTYKEVWDESAKCYRLELGKWVSADLDGINKILAGANPEDYLTAEDFLNNAISKGKTDGVL
ncbi:MAG: NotI family restriction endonuclease [Eubacteriales bacterium]